jgi:hypothetical protein
MIDKEKLKELLQDAANKIDFQVITLDGNNYCVFNDKQIKDFFKNSIDILWKGLIEIIKSQSEKKN